MDNNRIRLPPPNPIPPSSFSTNNDYSSSFSATVLRYINQVLMEEDLEEEQNNYNSLALQHAEKSFYDVIARDYPYPPHPHPHPHLSASSCYTSSSSTTTTNLENHTDLLPLPESLPAPPSIPNPIPIPIPIPVTDQLDLHYPLHFLPTQPIFSSPPPPPPPPVIINLESDDDDDDVQDVTSSQVHMQNDDANYENDLSQLFDKLLVHGDKLEKETLPSLQLHHHHHHHTRVRTETNYVDLRKLLMISAQAISSNDTSTANQLIKQIRQHSSPTGDATQRLAHFFANALEARLNGNGSRIYTYLSSKTNSAADVMI